MKCFVFYRKDILDDVYDSIYAYTDKKEVSDLFISQRDMNKFIYKKKNISKDEFMELREEIPSAELLIDKWKHRATNEYRYSITKNEKYLTIGYGKSILTKVAWETVTHPIILLTDEYMKSLIYLLYPHMSSYKSHDTIYNNRISYDMISCFIHLYGNSLRGGNYANTSHIYFK